MRAADIFKALSDETRLRIVNLLAKRRSMAVSDLVAALNMPQWHISRHLSRLRQIGLVDSTRRGTWMYYSLRDELREVVRRVIAAVQERIDENTIAADLRRLREVLNRRRGAAMP